MTKPFKSDYAFGLSVQTSGGHKSISHGGGIEGFNTDLEYFPDSKITVVVLGNLNGGAPGDIAKKLAAVAHGEEVKLTGERKEITLGAAQLNRYVGAYRMEPGGNMLIALEGNHLTSKLGNQPPVELFPESETMFFLKVVDAQVEFPKGDGQQVILHQNGRNMAGIRLYDADAKRLMDAAAVVAKRFKDQTAAPGSEAALKKMIEGVRAGKPDYDSMSASLAAATQQQLPQLQSSLAQLGATQSVTFKSVGPAGPDIYQVKFEKGALEYRIWMSPDGKIESANVRPVQ
jgi:hypothetical protein